MIMMRSTILNTYLFIVLSPVNSFSYTSNNIKKNTFSFEQIYSTTKTRIKANSGNIDRSREGHDTLFQLRASMSDTPVKFNKNVTSHDNDDNIIEITMTDYIDTTIPAAAAAQTSIQSILLLNFVAVIWGTQHSFIKMSVEDCDASAFTFSRFALAAIIATIGPLLFRGDDEDVLNNSNSSDSIADLDEEKNTQSSAMIENKEENRIAWRWGIEMGIWMLLGYAFQAIGLEYTTAQRSGFLLYLNIKLVPLFAFLIYQRQISLATWISAFAAVSGTLLLTFDGSNYSFNVGDFWSIAAAAASAMFILRLEFASKAVPNSAKLNSYSLIVVTVASLMWCLLDGIGSNGLQQGLTGMELLRSPIESTWDKVTKTISLHPLELIYLGGITTALANYIQTKAQKGISAERASIIYSLDPVYGAFFAYAILGEQLSSWGILGASIITIVAATNAFLDLSPDNNDNDDDEHT